MSKFGWSLPPGVSTLPGEEPYYCPVCGAADFDPEDGLPEDTYVCSKRCLGAQQAGYHRQVKEDGSPGEWVDADGRHAVDPYGQLLWSVGSEDDAIYFDYCIIGEFVVLESVVNSETGHFIETFGHEEVALKDAIGTAEYMLDRAIEWCMDNEVDFDPADVVRFLRDLRNSLEEP